MDEIKRRLLLKFGNDPDFLRRLETLDNEQDNQGGVGHQAQTVNDCQSLCSHVRREVVFWTIPILYR